jgi:V/A-type H+-transporting ATPase subunit I
MRKMDLLLYHREQEKFLEELRGLGVVHITAEEADDSAAAQELSGKAQLAQRVTAALKKVRAEKNIAASSAEAGDVAALLAKYEDCESKREKIEQEAAALKKDNNALTPWGNFDPRSVKRLAEVGVEVKFYTMQAKRFESLDKSQFGVETIAVHEGMAYFVSVFRGEAPAIPGAEETRLPDISLIDLNAKSAALETRRAEICADIESMAGHIVSIEKHRDEQLNSLQFEQARTAMKSEAAGKLLKLSGWVPQYNEEKVTAFLQNFPAYVAFRDPVRDDEVPVKLKNNPFSKLFEPILKLYSLPGYRELDYTPFAAPFFAIFFGLCLGDAGYGLIYILASIIGLVKAGPKLRPILMLGLTFGIATTVCGVLLNGFFGVPLFGGEGVEGSPIFASGAERFALLAALETPNGTDFPAMGFALVIGFIHMFFGMFVYVYTQFRDRGFMATIMPLSLMMMVSGGVILGTHTNFMDLGMGTFAVGTWQVAEMLKTVSPEVAKWMALGGLGGALLFNSLDKIIFMRPLAGLWELYTFVSGFFSNILSYLRLFALGLAGGLLGAAINDIGSMFIKNADGELNYASVGMVATLLVIIGGHALNLALASLGAFVHPLRLTFVEFYGAVQFQGGGKAYAPFAKIEN